jgi:hypothetical protein
MQLHLTLNSCHLIIQHPHFLHSDGREAPKMELYTFMTLHHQPHQFHEQRSLNIIKYGGQAGSLCPYHQRYEYELQSCKKVIHDDGRYAPQ